jgi:flagellum-specific peptidoglycan hydrolase FlgJ
MTVGGGATSNNKPQQQQQQQPSSSNYNTTPRQPAVSRRDDLTAQVTAKLQHELHTFYSKVRDEIDEEFKVQTKLESRNVSIAVCIQMFIQSLTLDARTIAIADGSQGAGGGAEASGVRP